MKILITLLLMVFKVITVDAQLKVPELSPKGKVIQLVGFTTFTVDYNRPAARGRSEREVFGKLVPFDNVWRTGASECTTISFSTDVMVNNVSLPKGKYSLFTIPGRERWTIILNKDTAAYGAFDYDQAKDVVRVTVPTTRTTRFYQSLTIDIDFIPNNARIYISWFNTQVAFDVNTLTDEGIQSYIKKNLIDNQSHNPEHYEAAITYYLWHQKDRKQVMNFINRGIALKNDRLWYYWKVEELMKDKQYKEALSAADAGIAAIINSDESEDRKAELILDFENYKKTIHTLKK